MNRTHQAALSLRDRSGPQREIEWLQQKRAELRSLMIELDDALDDAQTNAVDQGLALFTYGAVQERAPGKETFIQLYGRREFNRVKVITKPQRIFTWLVQDKAAE